MQKKWCWTKHMGNEANFSFKNDYGGINWGYCKKEQVSGPTQYLIEVETSSVRQAETRSTVKIQMFGDKGESKRMVLSDTGFERGSVRKIVLNSIDVGNIQKIIVFVVGVQNYQCRKISIISGSRTYNFECLNRINACGPGESNMEKCSEEMSVDGNIPYEVTIKTSDEKDYGTKSPILFNLIGTKGYSQTKLLGESGFEAASSKSRTVYINDIGELTGFKLVLTDHGKWKPLLVTVLNKVTKTIKNFHLENVVLINPGKETYILDSNKKKEISNPSDDQEEKRESILDINNPDGGLIEYSEKKDIINLKCEQTLVNPDPNNMIFGPDFATKFVNYMNILAKCPSDCHKFKGKILGVGIHPMQSPICLSAIVDKAISLYGGIISISIFPGLDKYTLPIGIQTNIGGITVSNYGASKKSYTINKVDNVDLVEKDIRILNSKGMLSNSGRLEVRKEGVWGTICSIGNNRLSAKRVCIDLGYKDGEWLSSSSSEEAKGFCRSFNGADFCGAELQPIHFSNLECRDYDNHFNKCNKIFSNPKECSHDFDSIINCYNTNFQVDETVPQGVVRLEQIDRRDDKIIGRLEIYRGKSFLPVCFLKFNKNSAETACKQMGFEEGDIASEEISESFRLPEAATVGFSASEVECHGGESKLDDCKKITKNIMCRHSQDVVIICSKGDGDSSGKSQYNKPPISSPPQLSKLGLKKYHISCNIKANSHLFRGDPGSIYLVVCPKDCGKRKGSIWGTGIYTSNSYICKAAIHAGVIDDNIGGTLGLTKIWGSKFYFANDINGIKSYEHFGDWQVSFTVSKVNTGWENMEKLHRGVLGSFLEVSKQIMYSSFIQTNNNNADEMYIPTPIYQWIPENKEFSFSTNSFILDTKNKISSLNKFSILIQFTMKDFKYKKEYIFSYKNCKGVNVVIDETGELVIGDLCNDHRWVKTRMMIPLNVKIVLFLRYIKGTLVMIYKSSIVKSPIIRSFNVNLETSGKGPIAIGRHSKKNNDHFFGKVDYVQLYDIELDNKLVDKIVNSLEFKQTSYRKEKTIDNRECVKPCTDNPVPGSDGSPDPPAEAKPSASVEIPKINGNSNPEGINNKEEVEENNGINGSRNGKGNGSNSVQTNYGTYDKRQENNLGSIEIDCDTNLLDTRFNGGRGKIFRVKCRNCIAEDALVYGTAIYHPKSSICKAALHSGILSKRAPFGDVIVKLERGFEVYNGSIGQDGSNSASLGKSTRSFKLKKASPLKIITCTTTASTDIFAQAAVYSKFVVQCPQKCSKMKNTIYGSEIYTDNSPICLAAIHHGIITDVGGEIELMIEKGMNDYRGTKGFGIESQSKGPHVRSYRFLGIKSGVFYQFIENYDGNIDKLWKLNVNKEANNRQNNFWKYLLSDNNNSTETTEKVKTIHHDGIISVPGNNHYATWINLRNVEFANGIIKFNFLLKDDKPIAFLFRYTSYDNFYAIEFDMKSSTQNIRLIRKLEGQRSIIDSRTIKLIMNKWYRWQLILNFDYMQLFLQQDKIRENKMILQQEIPSISRGSIAIATNGNRNFMINGIEIDEYNPNKKKNYSNNHRTWYKLLEKVSLVDRKNYCRMTFNNEPSQTLRCMEVHNYCKLRCDETIPPEENIINFSCFKDCVRKANSIEVQSQKSSPTNLMNKTKWIPKKNEKCDYKPSDNPFFIPCKVTSINEKKTLVKLSCDKIDNKVLINVQIPNKNLFECGKMLTERTDCGKIKDVNKRKNKKKI